MKKLANNNKLLKLIKMNKSISNDMPTAHVTIKKSRIKQYNKKSNTPIYYLKNNTEFELEIFNPRTTNVLAIIELNNKSISQAGLIIRAGERIFLERYLDIPKKFNFTTYEVNNSEEVKNAIRDNGDINIKFYEEMILPNYNTYTYSTPDFNYPNYDIWTDTRGINKIGPLYGSSISTSNYTLKNDDSITLTNNTMSCFSNKIYPLSQKTKTNEDLKIKQYCTSCGSKIKKNDKYCAQCGSKM
jgi:hypothetical protein